MNSLQSIYNHPTQEVIRPVQTSPLLHLPNEILLLILNQLSPEQSVKARGICFKFNQIMGEVLRLPRHIDFLRGKIFDTEIKKPQQQQGSWLGRSVTALKYQKVNLTVSATDRQRAVRVCHKVNSLKLYLSYLTRHATASHRNTEEALKQIEQLERTLQALKYRADENLCQVHALTSTTSTAQKTSATAFKTLRLA